MPYKMWKKKTKLIVGKGKITICILFILSNFKTYVWLFIIQYNASLKTLLLYINSIFIFTKATILKRTRIRKRQLTKF